MSNVVSFCNVVSIFVSGIRVQLRAYFSHANIYLLIKERRMRVCALWLGKSVAHNGRQISIK